MNTPLQRDWVRVFLSVAIGCFFGMKVFHQFAPHLSFVGVVVGGLLGYVLPAPVSFARAVGAAIRLRLQSICATSSRYLVKENWAVLGWGTACSLLLSAYGFAACSYLLFLNGENNNWLAPLVGMLVFAGCQVATLVDLKDIYTAKDRANEIHELRRVLWEISPFNAIYIVVRAFFSGGALICLGCAALPFLIWEIGPFCREIYRRTHTSLRIVCMMDAALGTLLFGILGIPELTGAFIGGVFGVFNWEIMAKRVLKTAPARSLPSPVSA